MEKCDRFVSKRYDRHFYVGESLETIKLAIQKNNYSSVELLDNTKFDFYADLFYKSDTRKIKELILSRTMCDPNDKQSAELRDIFEGVKHLEGLVFTYNTEILSSIYILQNLCRLTVHGVIDDKDSNLYLSLGPLRSLTHLHIDSEEECIKMLNKLCDSPDNRILRDKLTHLVLQMPCGHGSVFRTTIFESLEVLIMGPLSGAAVPPTFWSGFPSRLREIKIDGLTISCGALFHLIGDLRHLQLLNVGNGDIFADNDLGKFFLYRN